MTRPTTWLPTLDGTRAATNARLGVWLGDSRAEAIDDALDDVRAHLEEARSMVSELGKSEECDNEECTQVGDVAYLRDELDLGREALEAVEAAVSILDETPVAS